ncbi:MAG: BrnA antitoxin family protein [Gammaproteobacteria bacterium]
MKKAFDQKLLDEDSSEFIDWNQAEKVVFPNLKPSTRTISLRLSESMLNEIKVIAHGKDVPYQSLMKVWFDEQIKAYHHKHRHNATSHAKLAKK